MQMKSREIEEEQVLRIVARKPMCNWGLVEVTGLSYRQVQRMTNKLRRERRIIRVCGTGSPMFYTIQSQGKRKDK